MVTAVISLNVPLNDWENNVNSIQTKVKNAIAVSAGVTPDKVILGSAVARGTGRRLLSYNGQGIDVIANVVGTRKIRDLDKHISKEGILSKGYVWSENHIVLNHPNKKFKLQQHHKNFKPNQEQM
jgi:hypothetical protein